MKILLISQYYKPVRSAATQRTSKIAQLFSNKGHEVTVLTGFPSYPLGIMPQKYRWKLWAKEKDEKIKILRTYEFPAPAKGVIKRLANMISFSMSATLAALIMPRFDVVIVSSPSFLSGIAGLVAHRGRNKFFFDVRDLWPDSALKLGYLKNGWLLKIAKKLEQKYYSNADKILVATPGIRKHLLTEKVPQNKIVLLINCSDSKIFKVQKIKRSLYKYANDDFIVCYEGNHSRVYALETVLESASLLKKYPQIKFMLIGEGEEKENLRVLSQKLQLNNVEFLNQRSPRELAKLINLADVGLISLANKSFFLNSIPSKTSEYLSCGKPILASIRGDLKEYLDIYQAGLIYPPGDSKELSRLLLELYHNPVLKNNMSKNALRLSQKVFSIKVFNQKLLQLIQK